LAFLGRVGTEIIAHLIRDFCPWESIHETGVTNSGVKSRGQYEIELSSAIGRVVEGLKGFTARNLGNMRAFYLAFPIWDALRAELLEKPHTPRDQLRTEEKLSALRSELSWTHYK